MKEYGRGIKLYEAVSTHKRFGQAAPKATQHKRTRTTPPTHTHCRLLLTPAKVEAAAGKRAGQKELEVVADGRSEKTWSPAADFKAGSCGRSKDLQALAPGPGQGQGSAAVTGVTGMTLKGLEALFAITVETGAAADSHPITGARASGAL